MSLYEYFSTSVESTLHPFLQPRCFQCRSDEQPDCGEPFHPSYRSRPTRRRYGIKIFHRVELQECDNFFTKNTVACFKTKQYGSYIMAFTAAAVGIEYQDLNFLTNIKLLISCHHQHHQSLFLLSLSSHHYNHDHHHYDHDHHHYDMIIIIMT